MILSSESLSLSKPLKERSSATFLGKFERRSGIEFEGVVEALSSFVSPDVKDEDGVLVCVAVGAGAGACW